MFALDVCASAVMSNHYHLVLHIDQARAAGWEMREVVERWHQLCKGSALARRFAHNESLDTAELAQLTEVAEVWRSRLMDISWFMRYLNEAIAREANREDRCTGRFWEGRFKSQALLDEQALAAYLAYVGLNPIRAKMADTRKPRRTRPSSDASKRRKTADSRSRYSRSPAIQGTPCPWAYPSACRTILRSGRCLRVGKRGTIDGNLPPMLDRLQIDPRHWLYLNKNFESRFKSLMGSAHSVRSACEQLGKRWAHGIRDCERCLSPPAT